MIIANILAGSRLFGTNTVDSDADYLGVYIPALEDYFRFDHKPKDCVVNNTKVSETKGNQSTDIDNNIFSLTYFFKLAASGQSNQLEMMFAPEHAYINSSWVWREVVKHRADFLSKKSITPIIGFATSNAHKYADKASRYDLLGQIIKWGESVDQNQRLDAFLTRSENCQKWTLPGINEQFNAINDRGYLLIGISYKQFDVGIAVKQFIKKIKDMYHTFGDRTVQASLVGRDYKSIMHAFRLVSEAEELMTKGVITLPRPDAEFLLSIRSGNLPDNFGTLLQQKIDDLKVLASKSSLPDNADFNKLNDLCIELHKKYYFNGGVS